MAEQERSTAEVIPFPARQRPVLRATSGIFRAPSDSMAPTIAAGDIVELDANVHSIDTDAVFVLDIGGEPAIRRVQRLPGVRARVSMDSAPHAAEVVDRSTLRVLGRVVRYWNEQRA